MIPGRKVWRDGVLVETEEATVSSLAHSMQRGSLVFDVLSFHDGERGVAVFRLVEHVRRFLRSASIVGLEVPYSESELCDAVCTAVRATGLRDGLIRMSGYFGSIESDLVPMNARATVVISAYARSDLPKRPSSTALRIQVPSHMRKAAPDAIPPLAKVAASYLGPMIARRAALAAGFDEIVLCDHSGAIAEAPTANVFAGIGGVLVTPPLGAILDGITRDTVMTLAREDGMAVVERPLSVDELVFADEAFLTATSYVVAPIGSVNGQEKQAPGPLTARLKARVAETFRGERWLTPVGGGRQWNVRLREEVYAVDRVLVPGERGEASEGRAAQVFVLDVDGLEVVSLNVFRLSTSERARSLAAVRERYPSASIVQHDGALADAQVVAGTADERQAAALAYLAVVMSWEERRVLPVVIDGRRYECTHDGAPQKEWAIEVKAVS